MSKIERGITFSFMRLNALQEPEFTKLFAEKITQPILVVMNPGKRKRFLLHDGPVTVVGVTETLDKILGGDAKFKAIKDNQLPSLVSQYE
jgi:hypothetical protein